MPSTPYVRSTRLGEADHAAWLRSAAELNSSDHAAPLPGGHDLSVAVYCGRGAVRVRGGAPRKEAIVAQTDQENRVAAPGSSDSVRYDELKARQLENAVATDVHGVPVEFGDGLTALGRDRGMFPILGCLCVHDSPDSLCPCGPIIWLPKDKILSSRKAGSRDREGREVYSFRVESDAELVVERPVPVRAGAYAAALKAPNGAPSVGLDGSAGLAMARGKGVGPVAAVVAAFEVGYALGTKINEAFGLSGKISDWLVDLFD